MIPKYTGSRGWLFKPSNYRWTRQMLWACKCFLWSQKIICHHCFFCPFLKVCKFKGWHLKVAWKSACRFHMLRCGDRVTLDSSLVLLLKIKEKIKNNRFIKFWLKMMERKRKHWFYQRVAITNKSWIFSCLMWWTHATPSVKWQSRRPLTFRRREGTWAQVPMQVQPDLAAEESRHMVGFPPRKKRQRVWLASEQFLPRLLD